MITVALHAPIFMVASDIGKRLSIVGPASRIAHRGRVLNRGISVGDKTEITLELKGLRALEIVKLEAYLSSLPDVKSVRWPDAPPHDPNNTYVGDISASTEVVRLVAELHRPLVVAGAAGTAAISGFAAKVGSGLGELVLQWFKDKIGSKGREVKATLYAPDGTVIKTILEKR